MYKLYEAKRKEEFLKTVNTREYYKWFFDKTFEYESKNGKDISNFNKNQLLEFLKDRNSTFGTLKSQLSSISVYTNWVIEKGLTLKSKNITEEISTTELKEIAKKDLDIIHVDIIDQIIGKEEENLTILPLRNAQDKLLVYLAFLGVGGDRCRELINLRESHIDKENGLIKLSELDPDRVDIKIDDFGLELVEKSLREYDYVRYSNKMSAKRDFKEGQAIEAGEGLIFRKSNSGKRTSDERMSHQGILRRLKIISKYTGVKLTFSVIRKSGMTYVAKLLKDAGIPLSRNNVAVQKSLFERFNIDGQQAQMKTIRNAKKDIEQVYGRETDS